MIAWCDFCHNRYTCTADPQKSTNRPDKHFYEHIQSHFTDIDAVNKVVVNLHQDASSFSRELKYCTAVHAMCLGLVTNLSFETLGKIYQYGISPIYDVPNPFGSNRTVQRYLYTSANLWMNN